MLFVFGGAFESNVENVDGLIELRRCEAVFFHQGEGVSVFFGGGFFQSD